VAEWTDEKNKEIFGVCNNPSYHGHNYELHVKITGYPDEKTGYVYDLKKLKDIIEAEVVNRFDHKNLNLDTVEFLNLNPTAENIARVIWNILKPKIGNELDLGIKLFETPRNYVEYNG
jgi:6-pyruvoyltetrahydropterin/6-carboxytetrahydropterin synthase